MKDYLFTSPRLGFRTWEEDDYPIMTLLNQDDDVMEFDTPPARHRTVSLSFTPIESSQGVEINYIH